MVPGWKVLDGKFRFPSRLRFTGDDVVVMAALAGRSAILTQFEMSAILGAPVSQPAQQEIYQVWLLEGGSHKNEEKREMDCLTMESAR